MSNTDTTPVLEAPRVGRSAKLAPVEGPKFDARTKAGRIERELQIKALRKEAHEQGLKAERHSADNKYVMNAVLTGLIVIAAAGFTLSFSGLYGAAEWATGPTWWLQLMAPLMLDLSIVVLSIKRFVEKERGDRGRGTLVGVWTLAVISSVANVLHALVVTTATTPQELLFGCALAGGAPFLLAYITDAAGGLVFRKAGRNE